MEFEWDEAKRTANLAKHGLDFADIAGLDWLHAIILPDLRADYGEHRFQAFAQHDGRLRQVTFTLRGQVFRIVSFRHANRKERKLYGP
ncbi:MAG: BrnT family toxin [Rhizomicrobium sp.]